MTPTRTDTLTPDARERVEAAVENLRGATVDRVGWECRATHERETNAEAALLATVAAVVSEAVAAERGRAGEDTARLDWLTGDEYAYRMYERVLARIADGGDPRTVIDEYRALTARPTLAPRWTVGKKQRSARRAQQFARYCEQKAERCQSPTKRAEYERMAFWANSQARSQARAARPHSRTEEP